MKKTMLRFLCCLFIFIVMNILMGCGSNSNKSSHRVYCDYCNKNVSCKIEWAEKYKYSNEYGYNTKIWNVWCDECGRYLGEYTVGIN